MKNIKSLLVAGTVATSLSVSAFLLPVSVSGTTINDITTCDVFACSLTTGDYTLGADINLSDKYIEISGAVSIDFAGHTITTQSINIQSGGELTLSGDGGVNGMLDADDSTLTINGGDYRNLGAALSARNNAIVNINGGNFTADNAAAVAMFAMSNPVKLTIAGGTFTSNLHYGIEIMSEVGTSEVKISGGTFQGAEAGLAFSGTASELELSGGDFKTGTSGMGAITMLGTDTSALNGLLASGYKYSDATASVVPGTFASNVVLTAREVTVLPVGAATPAGETVDPAGNTNPTGGGTETPTTPSKSKAEMMEEMAKEMERLIASSTSDSNAATKKTTTTTKKVVKAPNTGAVRE